MKGKIHIMYHAVNKDYSHGVFCFSRFSCKYRDMNNLARYRDLKGLSQRDLAELLKVSQPTIQRAETEHDSAKLGTYKSAAKELGITLSDIFSDRTEVEEKFLQMIRDVPPHKMDQLMTLIDMARDVPPEGDEEASQIDDPQET